MKIAVLVKQVPVVAALRFDPASRRIQRDGVPSEVSAFDLRALARAVELKTGTDDEVVVITMGPPDARAALIHCLALGADRALHLVDRAFAGADTLATARALAAALAREGVDLVLCGRHSVDAETGQVGPEVAELLGWVQATGVHRLDLDRAGQRLRAERETDHGYEVVEAGFPVLVTAAEDLAPERFPTKAAREAAAAKPIVALSAADLGLAPATVGASGSPTTVESLEIVECTREGRVVDGASIADAVTVLVAELDRRGVIGARTATRDLLPAPPATPRPLRGPAYWVVVEAEGGRLRSSTFELLGKAGELAGERHGHVAAILLGAPGDGAYGDALAARGADVIYVAEDGRLDPYTTDAHATVLADAIRARRPAAVLVAASIQGRDLAPRVAARLGLGLTGDCIDLGLGADGRLVQYKPAFGGNVVAPIRSRTLPDFATVRPGMLRAAAPAAGRVVPRETLPVELPGGAPRLRVLERAGGGADDATDLDAATAVIGVGKGVGGPAHLDAIRELAMTLGAALGATRDVTDLGWLPRQRQIGLTGRAIAPALYVAVGIRGAAEHTVGIRRAGVVVAINKNPKALIFKHADLGIVGDWAEVVPALVRALERRRGIPDG